MAADHPRASPANAAHHHRQLERLTYEDGELIWATAQTAGADDAQEPTAGRLRRDDIVFVLSSSSRSGTCYHIYSLSEAEQRAARTRPSPQFELSVLSAPTLPDELAEFVLDVNALSYLGLGAFASSSSPQPQPQPSLHVIVSSKSGTCQAQAFYDGVLRPLLGAVGIHEDTTQVAAVEATKGQDESYSSSSPPSPASRSCYTLTVTRSSRTIRDLARSRLRGGETVVLLSGDGGVTDLLNGCADNENGRAEGAAAAPTVALLPLGTGNALFHSLHKPLYEEARDGGPSTSAPASPPKTSPLVLGLRTLFTGTVAPLPTFRADFSPGSRLAPPPGDEDGDGDGDGDGSDGAGGAPVDHLLGAIVASYGFHASLVWESDTPAFRVHGHKRFGMAAQALLETGHAYSADVALRRWPRRPPSCKRGDPALSSLTPTPWHVVSPGNPTNVRSDGDEAPATTTTTTSTATTSTFNYVLATLVSNLERTFTISPASRPLDGQLRLVHFGDVGGGARVMDIMSAAYAGGVHVRMDGVVGYDAADEVRVVLRAAADDQEGGKGGEDARWRKFCVDGTIVEVANGGWMIVRRCLGAAERMRVLVDRTVLARTRDGAGAGAGGGGGGGGGGGASLGNREG